MDNIDIVKVSTQDLINMVEVIADKIWRDYYISIIGKQQVDYMLKKFQSKEAITAQIDEGFLYYLIKEKDDYIGYIAFTIKDKEILLSKIYVLSEKRGKGYGAKAMTFVEKIAKEKKCFKITLTVNKNNTNSIAFYEKFGFINAGSNVQDIGNGFIMDDYKMEKIVKNSVKNP